MVLAYNLSSHITDTLKEIDHLWTKLLLMPLSPRSELRLKWEATVAKTYWSLTLSNNNLTKNQMAKVLSFPKAKKYTKEEQEVINYKKALSTINNEWLVNGRPLSILTFYSLFFTACRPTVEKYQNTPLNGKKDLKKLFEFLHNSNEHPCLQAGIAMISVIEIAPFLEGNGRMARLTPYIYLYKNGYDMRGIFVLDEFLRRDLVGLNLAVESVRKSGNLTVWLEYFVKGCLIQLQKACEIAEEARFSVDSSATYTKLNNRQKEILDYLDLPGAKISNKTVQDKFKVSQITASRDLAKMHELDLILVHGKGRSTYYTKV